MAFAGLGQDFRTWTPKQTTLYTLRRREPTIPRFDYRMRSSVASTAPASGLHSCLSKSDWSCCLALSASTRSSRRVLKANLQTSQYATLGVLPMNRATLRFRSGIPESLQGTITESNACIGSAVTKRASRFYNKNSCTVSRVYSIKYESLPVFPQLRGGNRWKVQLQDGNLSQEAA